MYSATEVTATGQTRNFDFSFALGYLDVSHIHVYLDDVEQTEGFIINEAESRVTFFVAPPFGTKVLIRRIVPVDELYHSFEDGAIMNEQTLDEATEQSIMATHEVLDGFTTGSAGIRTDLNMRDYRIFNLADGIDDKDAINKRQLDAAMQEVRDDAEHVDEVQADVVERQDDIKAMQADVHQYEQYAHDWAVSDSLVNDTENPVDHSAKWHADRASTEADRAEAAANATGASVGEIKWFIADPSNPIDRSGMFIPDGRLVPKNGAASFLWLSVEAGQHPLVTQAEYAAGNKNAYVDVSDTMFRIPDIQGYYVRIPDALDGNTDSAVSDYHTGMRLGDTTDTSGMEISIESTFTGNEVDAHTHTTEGLQFNGDALPNHQHYVPVGGSGDFADDVLYGVTKFYDKYENGQYVGLTGQDWVNAVDDAFFGLNGEPVSAGKPSGTITGTIDEGGAFTPSGTVESTAVVTGADGVETRPKTVYMQPYIVYAQDARAAGGISLHGSWDVENNVVTGDALNTSLQQGVAPAVMEGQSPNGVGYVVAVAGESDLTGETDTYTVADRVVWIGEADAGAWAHLKLGEVTSVNGQTGDALIAGDNTPMNSGDLLGATIKEYVDTLVLEAIDSATRNYPSSTYITLGDEDPNDLFNGDWVQIRGNYKLETTSDTGINLNGVGTNTVSVPVPAHTHTMEHKHTRGDMDITGWITGNDKSQGDGKVFVKNGNVSNATGDGSQTAIHWDFKASGNWTGSTSSPSVGDTGSTGTSGATIDVRGAYLAVRVWFRLDDPSAISPVITDQVGDITAVSGHTVELWVESPNTDAYQWQQIGSEGEWVDMTMSGADSASMTINAANDNNGSVFRCLLTNSVGYTYTANITLTVTPTDSVPVIVDQSHDMNVVYDTAYSLFVDSPNADTYQWQKVSGTDETTGDDIWSDVAGGDTASVTYRADIEDAVMVYRCKVDNVNGTTYSDTITVTVI